MELAPLPGSISSPELQEGLLLLQQIQVKKDSNGFTKLLQLVRRYPHHSVLIPLFDQILHLFEENTNQFGFAIVEFAKHVSFFLPKLVGLTPPSLLKHITRCFEKCHPESWILTLKLLEAALPITEACDLIHHYVLLSFHQSDEVMLTAYRFSLVLMRHSASFPSFFATWADHSIASFPSIPKQKRILILLGCVNTPLALSRGLFYLCLEWLKHPHFPTPHTPLHTDSLASNSNLSFSPRLSNCYIQATALRLLSYSPELTEKDISWVLQLIQQTKSPLVLSSVYKMFATFPHIKDFQSLDLLLKGLLHPHVAVKNAARQLILSWIYHDIPIPFTSFQSYLTDSPVTKESYRLISACLQRNWIRDPRPLIQWFLNYVVTSSPEQAGFELFLQFAKVFPKYAPILQQFLMSRCQDLIGLLQPTSATSPCDILKSKKDLLRYARVQASISKYLSSLMPFKETIFECLIFSSEKSMHFQKSLGKDYASFCRYILLAWIQHPKSLDVHLSCFSQLDIESHYLMARDLLKIPDSPWVHVSAQIFERLSRMTLSTRPFLFLEHWMYLAKGISGEISLLDGWQSAWLRIESLSFLFQKDLLQLDLLLLEKDVRDSQYFLELSSYYAFLMSCSPYLRHGTVVEQRMLACQCIAKGFDASVHVSESLLTKHGKKVEGLNQILQRKDWMWKQIEPHVHSIIKQLPRDYFYLHVPWFVDLFIIPRQTKSPLPILPNVDFAFQAYGYLKTSEKSVGIEYGQLGVLVCNRSLTNLFRDLTKRKTLMEIFFEQDEESNLFRSFCNLTQADYLKVHPLTVANEAFSKPIAIPFKHFNSSQIRYVVIVLRMKLPNGQWWETNNYLTLPVQVSDR